MQSISTPINSKLGIKAVLSAALAASILLCINPAQAQTTPTVANSIFNVFTGGKITLGDTVNTQAFCNPSFYDSPQLNVTTANLLGTKLCKSTSSTATASPATTLAASGANVSRLTLPTYLSTGNLLDVNYANSTQVIVNNGSTSTTINGAGQLTVTSNSGGSTAAQTLTLKVQGSTLVLPAGEYAKVATQAGGVLHFQAGAVPTRIKQLTLANCNGNTMEFEPGEYYIENASWPQSCNLTVSPAASGNTATSVKLYFKNAFTLNAGPTCWNISGTCGSTMGATQIQAQQAQKLKLYLYSGNFSTVQGAQIAAGIYVDQGDVSLNSANNFAVIGEVWAKNISVTNGGPTVLAYQPVFTSANSGGGGTATPPTIASVQALLSTTQAAPANGNFIAPASISLSTTATAASGSTISQVQFYQGSTLIGTATAPTVVNGSNGSTTSTYSITWANVSANSYSITAKATDSKNNTTTTTPVTVNVINNNPPSISLTANPANAAAPATIILNATATDSDGTVAKVEFFNGSTTIATLTTAPFTTNWVNVPTGSYSLTAKATDNLGATKTSTPVPITVTAGVPQVYDIQTDHINTPRVITDANGNEVWRWDSAPFGETAPNEQPTPSTAKFTFNFRFPGQYFDQETNLHYNYFRDYDPQAGRYVESDPIGLRGGINTYLYVSGRPFAMRDRFGLIGEVTGGGGATGGGALGGTLGALGGGGANGGLGGGGALGGLGGATGSGGATGGTMGAIGAMGASSMAGIDGDMGSSKPYLPGPFDILVPGTPANDEFVRSINRIIKNIKNACDDLPREKCKKQCADTYGRDSAECDTARTSKQYSICMERAGKYLGECINQCDGK